MIYPLTALFFGTGNQTSSVSSAIIARVFLDQQLRLFHYCPKRLLNEKPEMFAFDRLSDIYSSLAKLCQQQSNNHCKFFYNRCLKSVQRYKDYVLVTDHNNNTYQYDIIIFSSNADTTLQSLQSSSLSDNDSNNKNNSSSNNNINSNNSSIQYANIIERVALGNVKYYYDITFTHTDDYYMKQYYNIDLKQQEHYFVRNDDNDQSKIEMSFNLTCYQPQFKNINLYNILTQPSLSIQSCAIDHQQPLLDGKSQFNQIKSISSSSPSSSSSSSSPSLSTTTLNTIINSQCLPPPPPPATISKQSQPINIYQTIFLDDHHQFLWTWKDINVNKILLRKWWKQFSHSWKHFALTVPFMRFIQGYNRTYYCGSYTLFNTHEIAIISGLAIAYRLGADYPFHDDQLAKQQFNTYLSVVHGYSYKDNNNNNSLDKKKNDDNNNQSLLSSSSSFIPSPNHYDRFENRSLLSSLLSSSLQFFITIIASIIGYFAGLL